MSVLVTNSASQKLIEVWCESKRIDGLDLKVESRVECRTLFYLMFQQKRVVYNVVPTLSMIGFTIILLVKSESNEILLTYTNS